MEVQKSNTQTTLKKNCLEIYNPKNVRLVCKKVSNIKDIFKMKAKSLATIKKEFGEDKMSAIIKLHLIELNEILDLNKPLSENAIEQIADSVLEEYYNLTMPDIYLIFKRAKTGYYGEFFESINMPKVLKWFRNYFDERCNTAEVISDDRHYNQKENRGGRLFDFEKQKKEEWYKDIKDKAKMIEIEKEFKLDTEPVEEENVEEMA